MRAWRNTLSSAQARKIEYPTSDGRPIAESDWHRNELVRQIRTLSTRFAKQKVYVTGNLLLYYREGDEHKRVAPDVMVVKGAEPRRRDNYLLWEERISPQFVMEITSKKSKDEDLIEKRAIYENEIGVNEFFLFDPTRDYLDPCLLGYRLVRGKYEPIEPVGGRLESKELGLFLEVDGKHVRFHDPMTGDESASRIAKIALQDMVLAKQNAILAEQDEIIRKLQLEIHRLKAQS